MANIYVSDNLVMIGISGLRTIKKEDSSWSDRTSYSLKWQYKGQEGFQVYPTAESRDAMYEKVSTALKAMK